jgi:hypothetical protein
VNNKKELKNKAFPSLFRPVIGINLSTTLKQKVILAGGKKVITEEFLDIYSFSGEERNADEYLESLRDKTSKNIE